MKNDFTYGLKRGLPIAFGYLPVSFTFGLMAVSGGLPIWMAVFISMSNLTSAGQFAGTRAIFEHASYFEITFITFIINIRYMLMSLSLSQKIETKMTLPQRLLVGFGVTDEIFTMASMEHGKLSFSYLVGLILGPFIGWSLGTLLGASVCSALPEALSNAMGIALYGMFIAIIVPPAKHSRKILFIIFVSATLSCILKYVPIFSFISSGFSIIIATLIAASLGAYLFPSKEDTNQE